MIQDHTKSLYTPNMIDDGLLFGNLYGEELEPFLEVFNKHPIDSRLEALTSAIVWKDPSKIGIDIFIPWNNVSTFMRRLSEVDTETADRWENDILMVYYGIEVI